MRILVVEDEKYIAEMLKTYLNKYDYEVEICFDANQAFDSISKSSYDIYLVDIILPGSVSGYEIVKYIRTINKNANIIMMTAQNGVENLVKAYEVGCDQFISKPFSSLKELEAKINYFIRSPKRYIQINNNLKYDTISNQLLNMTTNDIYTLTLQEQELLKLLVNKKMNFLTNEEICMSIWEDKVNHCNPRNLINRLKRSIPEIKDNISNEYGKGYKLIIT